MSDLEIKFLRRLMARDAAIWAQRNNQKLLGGRETAQVLAEWQADKWASGEPPSITVVDAA
jgi:hypothetical protein